MPAGYSSRCKTCNSPHRTQIEKWKEDGMSTLQISLKLREMGEPISCPALENHFAEHYDVQAEVREQYYRSQAALQQAAGERVSEIQALDELVSSRLMLHRMLERILASRLADPEDDLPKLPMAYVSLYTGCASEIRQCLKTRQELLGDDPDSRKASSLAELVLLAAASGSPGQDPV